MQCRWTAAWVQRRGVSRWKDPVLLAAPVRLVRWATKAAAQTCWRTPVYRGGHQTRAKSPAPRELKSALRRRSADTPSSKPTAQEGSPSSAPNSGGSGRLSMGDMHAATRRALRKGCRLVLCSSPRRRPWAPRCCRAQCKDPCGDPVHGMLIGEWRRDPASPT